MEGGGGGKDGGRERWKHWQSVSAMNVLYRLDAQLGSGCMPMQPAHEISTEYRAETRTMASHWGIPGLRLLFL